MVVFSAIENAKVFKCFLLKGDEDACYELFVGNCVVL